MGKIVCLMGKSSTGKDTIFKEILREQRFLLKTIVPYTTRPIRRGERDGVEYFFVNEEKYQQLLGQGKVIEGRSYDTFHGLWRYFTVDDGQLDLARNNYILIGTLEAYKGLKSYFGQDKLVPVMIELDDGIRLQRALNRERKQTVPKYEEMCRRFLADSEDFSEEKIKLAGVERRFENRELRSCLQEIYAYLEETLR
ncbi:MAG: guanylate kinase [Lachnospiraceae bacterium]|nr:guanylate kinase [Lachnospiraceae bacterium]